MPPRTNKQTDKQINRLENPTVNNAVAETTCSEDNENQQHQLENEEGSDDEVDGSHVDAAVDF